MTCREARHAPRLWIRSDLHLEQSWWDLPAERPEHDVIVAAGEVHVPASRSVEWLAARADGRPVVLVPGNREWYAERRDRTVEEERARAAARAAELGVHLLIDDEIVIDGARFLGAMLWTDHALYGDPERSALVAEQWMNDHRMIVEGPDARRFAPRPAAPGISPPGAGWRSGRRCRTTPPSWSRTTCRTRPRSRHVTRATRSTRLSARTCPTSSSTGGATLWVHGHTHVGFDYVAGGTRVVCNPKGYGPTDASRTRRSTSA